MYYLMAHIIIQVNHKNNKIQFNIEIQLKKIMILTNWFKFIEGILFKILNSIIKQHLSHKKMKLEEIFLNFLTVNPKTIRLTIMFKIARLN